MQSMIVNPFGYGVNGSQLVKIHKYSLRNMKHLLLKDIVHNVNILFKPSKRDIK